MLRRNRSQQLLSQQQQQQQRQQQQSSSAAKTPAISTSSSSATLNHYKLQTNVTSTSLPSTSSPVSSIDSGKSSFFQSHMPKALRSLSRGSTSSFRPPATAAAAGAPDSPTSTSPQLQLFSRNVLRKSHKRVPSGHELLNRRSSAGSDAFRRISRASTTLSSSSSSNFIDWRTQAVEKHISLEYTDPQTVRLKGGYLVTTTDYILIFRSSADATAAFPQLAAAAAAAAEQASDISSPKVTSMLPPADPLHVISLPAVISVFRVDSARPPLGIEIWWRLSYPTIAVSSIRLFFRGERARDVLLDGLVDAVKTKRQDQPEAFRVGCEIEDCIRRIFRVEEPNYSSSEPDIFPVVYRNAPERMRMRSDDRLKKGQLEGTHSHYLAIGVNLCCLIEIGRASVTQATALEVRYQTCGLVTLEAFHAVWTPRDERFSMRFRDPFKNPILLELSSHQYRHIILTFTKADKFLKPAWPTPWQTQEVFHVNGLPIYQQIAAGEDFGGFQRTLTAFCAGYRCEPVDWEINWRTAVFPEFRVLTSTKGIKYTDVQILAVLRALRYNDYFKAVSFRDVDLSSLLDKYDSTRMGNIAYMSRHGVCLTTHETSLVQKASLMHQEFHALAFASGKIRQMDFSNCLRGVSQADRGRQSVQFLIPILNLLAAGLTRCNRLILKGCSLGDVDVESLVACIAPNLGDRAGGGGTTSQEATGIEALDISQCGLSEESMETLFQALAQSAWTLQELDVSDNFGRVPAPMIQSFMENVANLRHLNLSGCLSGSFAGEFLSLEALARLGRLEHLDLSSFKINDASLNALAGFIASLAARQIPPGQQADGCCSCSLRQLVLNNCGITGHGAGRIFGAMAGLYGFHLYLNNNPLEIGVSDLADALGQCWGGCFGLHMDMVEFQEEDSYATLISALAASPCIDYLSLVGTAPMPTTEDTCSEQTCAALEEFFRENQSVRYLDLSGFCGKLDDGQLGKGAGRALRGLSANKTLTHLRIRNQNLYDSIGILGAVIQSNTGLRYLDCGDNGFNLTSQRFISKSLEGNSTILTYEMSKDEVEQVLKTCLKDISPPPQPASKQKKGGSDAVIERQRLLLREEIEAAIAEILSCVSRNRMNLEHATGCLLDLEDATDTGGTAGWPRLQLVIPDGMMYEEGIAPTGGEGDESGQVPVQMGEQMQKAPESASAAHEAAGSRQSLLSSALHPTQGLITKPYQVAQDDESTLNSPTDAAGVEWKQEAVKETKGVLVDTSFLEKAFLDNEMATILDNFTLDGGPGYAIYSQT